MKTQVMLKYLRCWVERFQTVASVGKTQLFYFKKFCLTNLDQADLLSLFFNTISYDLYLIVTVCYLVNKYRQIFTK